MGIAKAELTRQQRAARANGWDAICRAAEISLAPHLGEAAPEPLTPRDYFLS